MTSAISCQEHELVAAVRRGEDRAFEELFARYRRRITSYVLGMVADHARAEDITQEVFISALRRIRETERTIAFKPWIYEIAKNACIDEFRRNRRSQEVSFEEDHGAGNGKLTMAFHELTPHAALESKQRLDDLCGAFVGLSENHHRILVMREFEGLSYGEIGERLGMSRPMVESTLFRARRRLSEEYDELVSGRRCEQVRLLIDSSDAPTMRALGVRDRRRVGRHLSHCQFCRRHAQLGGLDEELLQAPRPLARIAALVALPWLRWRRSGADDGRVAQSGSHSVAIAQSLPNVARLADPLGPSVALGRAAVAVAAVAIASVGGGLVGGLGATEPGARAPISTRAAAGGAPAGVLSVTNILTSSARRATTVPSGSAPAVLSTLGAGSGSPLQPSHAGGEATTGGPRLSPASPAGSRRAGTGPAPAAGSSDDGGSRQTGSGPQPASGGSSSGQPTSPGAGGSTLSTVGGSAVPSPSGAQLPNVTGSSSSAPSVNPDQQPSEGDVSSTVQSAEQGTPPPVAQATTQVEQAVPAPGSTTAVQPPSSP